MPAARDQKNTDGYLCQVSVNTGHRSEYGETWNSIKGFGARVFHKGYTSDERSRGREDYPPGPESSRKLPERYRDRLTEYIS